MAKRVPNQTLEQQLEATKLKANAIRHAISERKRAAEARRKIVIGGTVELVMQDDPAFRAKIIALLRQHVTRPLDIEAVAEWLSADGTPTPEPSPADRPTPQHDAAQAPAPEMATV